MGALFRRNLHKCTQELFFFIGLVIVLEHKRRPCKMCNSVRQKLGHTNLYTLIYLLTFSSYVLEIKLLLKFCSGVFPNFLSLFFLGVACVAIWFDPETDVNYFTTSDNSWKNSVLQRCWFGGFSTPEKTWPDLGGGSNPGKNEPSPQYVCQTRIEGTGYGQTDFVRWGI